MDFLNIVVATVPYMIQTVFVFCPLYISSTNFKHKCVKWHKRKKQKSRTLEGTINRTHSVTRTGRQGVGVGGSVPPHVAGRHWRPRRPLLLDYGHFYPDLSTFKWLLLCLLLFPDLNVQNYL